MEMHKMYPKVLYLVIWPIFGPPTQKMTPYTTMEVHLEAHIFLKAYINSYYQKIYLFFYFCAMKMHKMYPKVVYPVILTYFRTP